MDTIVIHEQSDAYVYVTLQRSVESPPDSGNWEWVPETAATRVDFEVIDPDGQTLGVKGLGTGASHIGGGKYRALYHFPSAGVYRTTARCEGSGGGKVTASEDLPVESL